MKSRIVDAEMVRDLMHHGHGDLHDDLVLAVAHPQDRVAEHRDPVRQYAAVVPAAVGQGVALVQAEQVGAVRGRVVLHHDHDILHRLEQLWGDLVEGVADQLLEPLPTHQHRHACDCASPYDRGSYGGETDSPRHA